MSSIIVVDPREFPNFDNTGNHDVTSVIQAVADATKFNGASDGLSHRALWPAGTYRFSQPIFLGQQAWFDGEGRYSGGTTFLYEGGSNDPYAFYMGRGRQCTFSGTTITTSTGHGYAAGSPVLFSSTGTLPATIAAGVTYYVLAAGLGTNTLQIAATDTSTTPISFPNNGTGMHHIDPTSGTGGQSAVRLENINLRDNRVSPAKGTGIYHSAVFNGTILRDIFVGNFPERQIYIGAPAGISSDCILIDEVWVNGTQTGTVGIDIERVDNIARFTNIKSDISGGPTSAVIRIKNVPNDACAIQIDSVKHESKNLTPTIYFPGTTRGNITLKNIAQRTPSGTRVGGDVVLFEDAGGGRTTLENIFTDDVVNGGQNCTFGASTNDVTCSAHGLVIDDKVRFSTEGQLPGNLASATDYWVVAATTNTFKVSGSKGGAAINFGTSSGTHYVSWLTKKSTVCINNGGSVLQRHYGALQRGEVGKLGRLGVTVYTSGNPNGAVYGNAGYQVIDLNGASSGNPTIYEKRSSAIGTPLGWVAVGAWPQTINPAAEITMDASKGLDVSVGPINTNIVFKNPIGLLTSGMRLTVMLTSDGTSRTLTWSSAFKGAVPTSTSGTSNARRALEFTVFDANALVMTADSGWV